jgi:hypothetical protein
MKYDKLVVFSFYLIKTEPLPMGATVTSNTMLNIGMDII